jgi:hypothetical protein
MQNLLEENLDPRTRMVKTGDRLKFKVMEGYRMASMDCRSFATTWGVLEKVFPGER